MYPRETKRRTTAEEKRRKNEDITNRVKPKNRQFKQSEAKETVRHGRPLHQGFEWKRSSAKTSTCSHAQMKNNNTWGTDYGSATSISFFIIIVVIIIDRLVSVLTLFLYRGHTIHNVISAVGAGMASLPIQAIQYAMSHDWLCELHPRVAPRGATNGVFATSQIPPIFNHHHH